MQRQSHLYYGVPVFDLGHTPLLKEDTCGMCSWLNMHDEEYGSLMQSWHLRVYPFKVSPTFPGLSLGTMGIMIRLDQGYPREVGLDFDDPGFTDPMLPVLVPTVSTSHPKLANDPYILGHYLKRRYIDSASIASLMRTCMDRHQCEADPSAVLPNVMRVIDCRTRLVVPYPTKEPYVALSYVWGGIKTTIVEDQLIRETHHLPSGNRIPQTVLDAMCLVLKLGFQYLWVDRYCIHQFHRPEDKKVQIPAMGDIFQKAAFTVVALGDNADSGLDGVSRPFLPQIRFACRGQTYVSSGHSLDFHFERSQWDQRAWVYQEAVLSKRCLVLTPEQAFLLCREGTSSETLVLPDDIWRTATGSKLSPFHSKLIAPMRTLSNIRDARRSGIGFLRTHLTEYRARNLTEASDRLNALQGVLGRMGMYSLYGVPLSEKLSTTESIVRLGTYSLYGPALSKELSELLRGSLALGLCWYFEERATRPADLAEHFPSWSWASTSRGNLQLAQDGRMDYRASISGRALLHLSLSLRLGRDPNPVLVQSSKRLNVNSYTFCPKMPWPAGKAGICDGYDGHSLFISDPSGPSIFWDTEEAQKELDSSRDGSLKAILMVANFSSGFSSTRSSRRYYVYSVPSHTWLLVHRQESGPARRVGILQLRSPDFDREALTRLTRETIEIE